MWSSRRQPSSNKIALPGRVWIASDIHLGPGIPATTQAFHEFLDQACAQADALILCGDVFDAWIGDDLALQDPPDWLSASLARLRAAGQRLDLWIGRGNRDFLMGRALMDHLGARLLPDPALLDTIGGPLLLSHGDEYCTHDAGYRRFRRIVRCPAVQSAFLALGLPLRRRIADWARRRSMASNQYKSREIMDVNPDEIAQALRDTPASVLVHGHTHRPGVHDTRVDGRACRRIVLPDWDYDHGPARGGWLQIDEDGIRLHAAAASAPLSATRDRNRGQAPA